MALSQDELERDVQSAEGEFLVQALSDDDVDDAGATDDDDIEFDEQLEIAGAINLRTGSASSDDEVVDFLANGCGCTKLANGPCSQGLSAEDVSSYRLAISELENSEVDLVILAQLHAGMNAGDLLTNTRGSARPGIRQRITFQYAFKGQPICREMFLFLHRISRTRLYNLVKHLCANGVMPRTRGHKGKLPKHARKFDEIFSIQTFPQPESANLPQPDLEIEHSNSPPPVKRSRLCSHCRLQGHTKTVRGKVTCPQLLKQ
jgi:hypothetical protein